MTPEFLFDFGSPNAYFAHKVIPGIEARTGVKFDYIPVLLGGIFKLTNNKPPMLAFGPVKGKMEYEMLETRRFIARHSLDKFQMNPNFPVNTLALMRMAVAAKSFGMLPAYVDAAFHHMWEAPKKMDDPDVIRTALLESGLDADRLIAAARTAEVKQALMNNTDAAVARGTFGIPTFFVGSEIYFGKNTLVEVEAEIVRAK
ncbi:MAG TPA: 2-hydroxychromene-2-carboxylate isomerase [Rhizomicrobium sp.]|jgi:2-hydroxychromene-2-carboxylate isomerase